MEVFGINVPKDLQSYVRRFLERFGATILSETWLEEVYPRPNIKIFFPRTDTDADLINLIQYILPKASPVYLEQLPCPMHDRLVFEATTHPITYLYHLVPASKPKYIGAVFECQDEDSDRGVYLCNDNDLGVFIPENGTIAGYAGVDVYETGLIPDTQIVCPPYPWNKNECWCNDERRAYDSFRYWDCYRVNRTDVTSLNYKIVKTGDHSVITASTRTPVSIHRDDPVCLPGLGNLEWEFAFRVLSIPDDSFKLMKRGYPYVSKEFRDKTVSGLHWLMEDYMLSTKFYQESVRARKLTEALTAGHDMSLCELLKTDVLSEISQTLQDLSMVTWSADTADEAYQMHNILERLLS